MTALAGPEVGREEEDIRLPLLVEDEAWRCALSWLPSFEPNSWSRPDGGCEEWQHGHVG